MEPITVHFDIEAMMAYTKQVLGYEAYAYWQFFLRDDAHEFIHKNVRLACSPGPALRPREADTGE